MNLFRITFCNQYNEFDYYLLSKNYPGDNVVRKLLIENQMSIKFDTELWKEFRINNPNYKLDYEIIEIEQVHNVLRSNP